MINNKWKRPIEWIHQKKYKQFIPNVATLLWKNVRMKLTLSKWGLGSPQGFPKLKSSIAGVKTPCIGVFFISLENYWSVDVENGLALTIWTFVAHVMARRRVGSQTGNLTPDHQKSRIDLTPVHASGVRHTISQREIQVCFRPHLDRRSKQRVMTLQNPRSLN